MGACCGNKDLWPDTIPNVELGLDLGIRNLESGQHGLWVLPGAWQNRARRSMKTGANALESPTPLLLAD